MLLFVCLQEQCARYWPDSVNSPDKIGSLTIELVEEKQFEDYLCRDIKVTDLTVSQKPLHSTAHN